MIFYIGLKFKHKLIIVLFFVLIFTQCIFHGQLLHPLTSALMLSAVLYKGLSLPFAMCTNLVTGKLTIKADNHGMQVSFSSHTFAGLDLIC